MSGRPVVVYVADGCHLCEAALEVIERVRAETPFPLEIVDIGGVAALEALHRAHLPVVEVGGRRAFTYHVHPEALRRLVAGAD